MKETAMNEMKNGVVEWTIHGLRNRECGQELGPPKWCKISPLPSRDREW